jgi:hypothetical protein
VNSHKHHGAVLWVAFVVWPFLTFLYSLANFSVKEYRKFVFLFFVYYGATFLISNPEVDANRYMDQLIGWSVKSWDDYINSATALYSDSATPGQTDEMVATDPFVLTINYLLSRFTIYKGALFGVFAALLGFFYLKAIGQLYDYKKYINNRVTLFYLLYFAFLVSIFSINGFRFWMACWVYFFGAYNFVTRKDHVTRWISIAYLFVACSSVLIHFSYILPVALLFLYFILGNRNYVYYPLLVMSFFVSINVNELLNFQSIDAPESVREKSQRYLSEGYETLYSKNREGLKWFIRYPYTYYFAGFVLIFVRIKHKLALLEPGTNSLFSFLLLFFSFTNFVMNEGQLIRFTAVFNLFAIAFIIRAYKDWNISQFRWVEGLGALAFTLHFFISFRIGSESINALLFGPGLLAFFQNELSIYDLIFK